jgi:hypothetical protein
MTDRMKNGECCPFDGYKGIHSPWCPTLRNKPEPGLVEALLSIAKYGDRGNPKGLRKQIERALSGDWIDQ